MAIRPQLTDNTSRSGPNAFHLSPYGFTLIEIIVILAVISILVAILTPTVLKYIEEAQTNRAEADVRVMNAALNDVIKDTGQYPGDKLTGRTFICGPGTQPSTGIVWCTGSNYRQLSNHLIINNPDEDGTSGEASDDYRPSGKFRWKGPYVQSLNEDPWGTAYAINASTLVGGNTNPTWVMSAGPNSVFDTATTATSLSGDDIGIRIK
jgi:prepilin-type N-terminal cleavage/methylation domain-containing protein